MAITPNVRRLDRLNVQWHGVYEKNGSGNWAFDRLPYRVNLATAIPVMYNYMVQAHGLAMMARRTRWR